MQLSLEFEKKHGVSNRFRSREHCDRYVHLMNATFQRFKYLQTSLAFKNLPTKKLMAAALFLLPVALYPGKPIEFSNLMMTNFISVCPSVEIFINSIPKTSQGPLVAIIGDLVAPASYAVYCQKKVYRCGQIWHAIDIAVKIYMLYGLPMASDAACAWQFIMLHFYELQDFVAKVYHNVARLMEIAEASSITM